MNASDEPRQGNAFESDEFRRVLGHFPTGVTVVTSVVEDQPVGFTIGSFTSVSLDPPLVGFLPTRESETWSDIERAGTFCVNVLGRHQADLCWTFASSRRDSTRFAGVTWHRSPLGSPILDRAVAWIDCTVADVHDAGDHVFVMGRVRALQAWSDGDDDGPWPLVFYRGALGRFAHADEL